MPFVKSRGASVAVAARGVHAASKQNNILRKPSLVGIVDNKKCFWVGWKEYVPAYEDVEGAIVTLGVLCALYASLTTGFAIGIDHEEFIVSDIRALSFRNLGFRQHFAPNETRLPCRGYVDPYKVYSPGDYDRDLYNNLLDKDIGCDSANIQTGFDINANVSRADAWAWITLHFDELVDRHCTYSLLGYCRVWTLPSYAVAYYGFQSFESAMACFLLAVLAYISLIFSKAREDQSHLLAWWLPVGCLFVVIGHAYLLMSVFDFMQMYDALVMIRYPYLQQHSAFLHSKRSLLYAQYLLGVTIVVHFVAHRIVPAVCRHLGKVTGIVGAVQPAPDAKQITVTPAQNTGQNAIIYGILQDLDMSEEHFNRFKDAKIDDRVLPLLKESHLLAIPGLPLGDAIRIWGKISSRVLVHEF